MKSFSAVLLLVGLILPRSAISAYHESKTSDGGATVVVAGAGPASLLFSYAFLRDAPQGTRIRIYEKTREAPVRYDDRKTSSEGSDDEEEEDLSFAFGFGLGDRAFAQLEACSPDLAERVRNVGAATPSGALRMTNRRDMIAEMTEALVERFGDQHVSITYGAEVKCANDDWTADVSVNGSIEKVPYDLLVAGDGYQSSVRDDLVRRGLIRCRRYLRPISWKALQLPSQPGLDPKSFLPLSRPPLGEGAPEEFGALMPRHGGRFVLLTFWNRRRRGRFHQVNPFKATCPQELREGLTEAFPQVTRLPGDALLRRYLDQKPGKETYMKLSRHAVPSLRLALIGDAAVGMYSRMGQGCASALERAAALASEMTKMNLEDDLQRGDIDEALRSFSRESVRQGHAITDLNLLSHLEYSPWFSRFMVNLRKLSPMLNEPELKYTDIKREFRGKVALSRLIWTFERLPMQSK